MAVVQIRNVAYLVKFLDKFLRENRVSAWQGRDRYLAEYSVDGGNVRLVCHYPENTVTVWFEPDLLKFVLSDLILHEEHLRKAVIIGVANVPVKGVPSGFIDASWGRVEILKVVRGDFGLAPMGTQRSSLRTWRGLLSSSNSWRDRLEESLLHPSGGNCGALIPPAVHCSVSPPGPQYGRQRSSIQDTQAHERWWEPWIEDWYSGFPFLRFYPPPLSYLIGGFPWHLARERYKGGIRRNPDADLVRGCGRATLLPEEDRTRAVRCSRCFSALSLAPWSCIYRANFPRANSINLFPLFLLALLWAVDIRERYLAASAWRSRLSL